VAYANPLINDEQRSLKHSVRSLIMEVSLVDRQAKFTRIVRELFDGRDGKQS